MSIPPLELPVQPVAAPGNPPARCAPFPSFRCHGPTRPADVPINAVEWIVSYHSFFRYAGFADGRGEEKGVPRARPRFLPDLLPGPEFWLWERL